MSKALFAVIAVVSACAALPAAAANFVFATPLSGAGEPVPTSPATGSATVTFNDVLDQVNVNLTFQGLANSSPFGHIHCCTTVPGTGSAGVSISFTPLPQATSGSYNNTFSLSAAAFDTLLAGATAGKAYVNIHTPGTYQQGEIRGFLALAPVPEPSTYALLLAGLGVVGWAARRRG